MPRSRNYFFRLPYTSSSCCYQTSTRPCAKISSALFATSFFASRRMDDVRFSACVFRACLLRAFERHPPLIHFVNAPKSGAWPHISIPGLVVGQNRLFIRGRRARECDEAGEGLLQKDEIVCYGSRESVSIREKGRFGASHKKRTKCWRNYHWADWIRIKQIQAQSGTHGLILPYASQSFPSLKTIKINKFFYHQKISIINFGWSYQSGFSGNNLPLNFQSCRLWFFRISG